MAIPFILNQKTVSATLAPGETVLDFVRYHQHLMGTKIGCREGDCGACTVLIGELVNDELVYRSVTSCLMPLGNAAGKHIVTVEGLNMDGLNPIQQFMCDEGATQCGFCTPGFVVSLAGFCLSKKEPTYSNAIASIDGNICRCTGYKSIERAAQKLATLLEERKGGEPVLYATIKKILPGYFTQIKDKLTAMQTGMAAGEQPKDKLKMVGGGTDLYVQQHSTMVEADLLFMANNPQLKTITRQGNECIIGGAATVSDLINCSFFHDYFPQIMQFTKLVSSTPIRNMATIVGNFINASPIGDLTIFFLALDAVLHLRSANKTRSVRLQDLYKGYKQLDKTEAEHVDTITFTLPGEHALFNFEKVSKRTHLDIASVNSAIRLTMDGDTIVDARVSAGGVAPIPMYLKQTALFLAGKTVDAGLVTAAAAMAAGEVQPISDARGTAAYKKLLLQQLVKAHFVVLFKHISTKKLMHAGV